MNRREKSKIKRRYLHRIEKGIQYTNTEFRNNVMTEYFYKLKELKELVCSIDYEIFCDIKHLFPNKAINTTYGVDSILSNTMVQREISFKLLDI